MIRNVITLQGNATVHEAVRLINKHKIGCLVILNDNGQIAGIVTERDLLERVLESCQTPNKPESQKS